MTLNKAIHINAQSRIGPYSNIGFGVGIHSNCSIGHHNVINQFSTIEPGVNMAGKVEIGEGTTVGPGSTIFHNIKIGSNSIIGGGSVVTKNVPYNMLAYGNPCKIIKKINF